MNDTCNHIVAANRDSCAF